jgi:superfamily II DNA/RNA helicase
VNECKPLVLGIAKTGSGKTAAFLLPALVHVMVGLRRLTLSNPR